MLKPNTIIRVLLFQTCVKFQKQISEITMPNLQNDFHDYNLQRNITNEFKKIIRNNIEKKLRKFFKIRVLR